MRQKQCLLVSNTFFTALRGIFREGWAECGAWDCSWCFRCLSTYKGFLSRDFEFAGLMSNKRSAFNRADSNFTSLKRRPDWWIFLEVLQKEVNRSSRQCCWLTWIFTRVSKFKSQLPSAPLKFPWAWEEPDVLWTALLMSACRSVTSSPALLPVGAAFHISRWRRTVVAFQPGLKRDRRSCFHTPLDTFNEGPGRFPAAFGGFEEVSGHPQPRVRRQKVMFLSRHLDEFQLCLCRQKLNLKKSKVFKQQLDTLV